ncbi:hypothetical protein E3T26_02270 [Cryobacterium sp. TMT1-21]|uniref:Large exoprotein n=1 Tax=Cryobacterium shii TaxID=1259235 RepID=A0AAQ2C604_9MICO|nr:MULTISPECIES: hypothetical protein [Cryobacterium]TFC46407.1 hypothetical protein E3O49_09855 [Cryobacterium shii]TFD17329.1 hypothetical protein E3T26_02270 [Cryobacterium sp. TMT1-21]
MSSEVLGGGVMIAVAAALWVTYLMPTWARRRQYLTTERNAVRLQQTLRILAETSEVPREVRLEANARTVVTQRKLLAQAEDDARAEAKAVTDAAAAARRAAAARSATERAAVAQAAAGRSALARPAASGAAGKASRLRRVRAVTSLFLLTGVVLFVSGAFALAAGGTGAVLVSGLVLAALAFGALSRLARTARRAHEGHAAGVGTGESATASRVGQTFEPVQLEETPVAAHSWTPHPLPLPMHLSRGSVAQTAMASVEAAAELRKAAAEAEVARRAAQLVVAATPLRRPSAAAAPVAAPAAATSRFASMGVVGETAPGMSDLDAVLRRRRAVG